MSNEEYKAQNILIELLPVSEEYPVVDLALFQEKKPRAQTVWMRLEVIHMIWDCVTDHTESYVPGLIGVDLAYLYPCIVRDEMIDLSPSNALARLLAKHLGYEHIVWAYINLSPNE